MFTMLNLIVLYFLKNISSIFINLFILSVFLFCIFRTKNKKNMKWMKRIKSPLNLKIKGIIDYL